MRTYLGEQARDIGGKFMTLLILSDTHGMRKEISHICERHKKEIMTFVHCGDAQLPAGDEILQPFIAVRGNCDFDVNLPNEQVISLANSNILVTHGHLTDVNYGLESLAKLAKEKHCQIACFGHTHRWTVTKINNIICINPGSIRQPRGRKERSYIILTELINAVRIAFYDLAGVNFYTVEEALK